MNKVIEKLDEKFKSKYKYIRADVVDEDIERFIDDDLMSYLHARDAALVSAIADAVSAEKLSDGGKSFWNAEIDKILEIIRSFGGEPKDKEDDTEKLLKKIKKFEDGSKYVNHEFKGGQNGNKDE